MGFLLIMVATGWVCSEHMAEERVHFSGEREREREIQEEKLRERIQERVKRVKRSVTWVFNLGLFDTSQWLS